MIIQYTKSEQELLLLCVYLYSIDYTTDVFQILTLGVFHTKQDLIFIAAAEHSS